MPDHAVMTLRPYQLMCAVCAMGEDEAGAVDAATAALLGHVRANPEAPATLRCNAGDIFAYQDPGTDEDTPEGAEFNVRRDLEILHKLDLFPGATMPLRMFFHRLLAQVEETEGICGYATATSETWAGCPKARSGCYQRGRAMGIDALIPPRTEEAMQRDKHISLEAIYAADAIRVRPHILLCAVCQYGQGIRPPFPEDNLPEMMALILREPERPIMLAYGTDWMMCAPCPYRTAHDTCVIHRGAGGLANQLRDLRVLQQLGLSFGATLPARAMFRLIFKRIPGTLQIDRLDHAPPSVWGDPCGKEREDAPAYAEGKNLLKAALGI